MIDNKPCSVFIRGGIIPFVIRLLLAIGLVYAGLVQAYIKPVKHNHPKNSLKLENILFPKSLMAALSPDGKTVLLTVSESDLQTDRAIYSAWKVPFMGGDPIRLTRGEPGDRSFSWRPDGKGISFLGKRGEMAGIFLINPNGGEPQFLFSHLEGINLYAWSPDGRKIAYLFPQKQDNTVGEIMDQDRSIMCLLIRDLEQKKDVVLIDKEMFSVKEMSWSPDSRTLVFAALLVTDGYISLENSIKSDLYLMPVLSTDSKEESSHPRLCRLTDNPGEDRWPEFSPDGRFVIYRSRPPGDLVGGYQATMIAAGGGRPSEVTPIGDRHHSRYVFAENNETVYFFGYRGVEGRIFRMSLDTKKAEAFNLPSGVNSPFDISSDGTRMVFTHSSPDHPGEVYTYEPAAVRIRKLTSMNDTGNLPALSQTETVRWRSRDEYVIEGLLVYPSDFNPEKRYPLVVEVHGGPAGLYARNFDPKGQYFASLGYFYFKPNFRGSAGYRRDFRMINIGDWGGGDLADVLSGMDALLERAYIDPERIGIMGWSYGGYLSAWAVTQTDRFKAAVVGAGFVENTVMWATNEDPLHFSAYFGGTPLGNDLIDLYRSRSPAAFAHQVRTPILIQHGKEDARVPTSQSVLWYRLLNDAGVPVELVLYPGMGHSPLNKPSQRLDIVRRQAKWFEKYLTPEKVEPGERKKHSFGITR